MLFKNPHSLLAEAAADLLDPEVSEEVKDVIDDLEDTLDNNVEEVKDEDKTTNGGIPVTTESVSIMESASNYGRARYLIKLEDVISIKENEGEEKAAEDAAVEHPGVAPTEEEKEAAEPDATNIVDDIASKNGVDPEQVAVVITAENVRFLAETALLEAKAGKKRGKAKRKLKKIKKTVSELEGKVKLVKA